MALTLISIVSILLFVTGTPILLVIAAWVAGASFFVADLPLASMGCPRLTPSRASCSWPCRSSSRRAIS